MTEKEKLLNGDFYNTRDNELIIMYKKARELINKFNTELIENPNEILKELLGNVEEGVWIEKPFFCDYGKYISIGKNTFINYN
ncbi:maltose acetyltransferase domain-containing protein [Paraclostridium dentum]|uniref:maltose acetyltransferase domain-containing protein n=1 Tax=Paraclostridium dentum TaxID=2662455 RepID=UPI003B00A32A